MKKLSILSAGLAMFFAANVWAGEYGNHCATGLSLGKFISTDCSINQTVNGKTYCFGNQEALEAFKKDPKGTIMKASDFYKKDAMQDKAM
jgi:YHS domain-containing protein